MKEDWTDGSFMLEMELPLLVNYQEIKERIYFQVFLQTDLKGEFEITRFLSKEEKLWIETNVVDALGENDGRG